MTYIQHYDSPLGGILTGYAGGIDKKVKLLELEHIDMSVFLCRRKGRCEAVTCPRLRSSPKLTSPQHPLSCCI